MLWLFPRPDPIHFSTSCAKRRPDPFCQNYSEAKRWYEKAAFQNYPSAQANLGSLYLFGEGVEKDYSKAHSWFLKSAKQCNPIGICNLGQLYEHGADVKQDITKAYAHYILASKEKCEITDTIMESISEVKPRMTSSQIKAGEQEAKRLMREYGLDVVEALCWIWV